MNVAAVEMLKDENLKKYIEDARAVIERPLDRSMIKERDAGFGKKLSYISGSTVINILNDAFGFYGWNWEIVEQKVIESLPKYNKSKNTMEEQPPYVQVLGRLTIPMLGIVKEQYGTKILIGGASEQEGATKSATTDAMKKCATMLGIGIELYEDSIPEEPKPSYQAPKAQPKQEYKKPNNDNTWNDETIAKHTEDRETLGKLKIALGLTDNSMLDPYVKEFLGDKDAKYSLILPGNIKKFNEFLMSKVEAM